MDGREHYGFILATSILPLLGAVGAIVLLWNDLVGVSDMVALGTMMVVAGLGVSTGYTGCSRIARSEPRARCGSAS